MNFNGMVERTSYFCMIERKLSMASFVNAWLFYIKENLFACSVEFLCDIWLANTYYRQ